jgi:hypothetical protein
VRLLRYLLAELGLLLAATAVLVTLVGQGTAAVGRRAAQRRAVELSQRYPLRQPLSQPPEPALASDASGTFLGMADDLLLARLRSAKIARSKVNKGGSSLSFRLDFADGSRAAFKPAQTNLQTIPRKEVAAYRLCRLLGLVGVPPAIPRAVTRDELLVNLHPESVPSLPRIKAETLFNPQGKTLGAASYWIPEIKDAGLDTPEGMKKATAWLTQGNEIPDQEAAMAAQFSSLVVFDFLTANPDRWSGGNIKMSPEGDRLYFMDNTMAFFLGAEGPERNRVWLERAQKFSRSLMGNLGRLGQARLERLLGPDVDGQEILTTSEIRAVLLRRDAVRRHVDALIAAHGEEKVLVFP